MPDRLLKHTASVHPPGARPMGAVHPGQRLRFVVILKPGTPVEEIRARKGRAPYAIAELTRLLTPDRSAVDRVLAFAAHFGFRVLGYSPVLHDITLEGNARAIETAFSVTMQARRFKGASYHGPNDDIVLPVQIADCVLAVVGLDGVPIVHSQTCLPRHQDFAHSPLELAHHYRFPPHLDGSGQRIAIFAFGGGYRHTDLDHYFRALQKISAPRVSHCCLGNTNAPLEKKTQAAIIGRLSAGDNPADLEAEYGDAFEHAIMDLETTQDIEIAGAVANGAHIDVYFSRGNCLSYYWSVATALGLIGEPRPLPAAISISWGVSESVGHLQSGAAAVIQSALELAEFLNVPVLCASGDFGSSGGSPDAGCLASVTFPASSPSVTACGGTQFRDSATGERSEEVWHDRYLGATMASGGGISGYWPRPGYQDGIAVPDCAELAGKCWYEPGTSAEFRGRAVPDIAAYADLEAGYRIVVGGVHTHGGGTSASTPLIAGLMARLRQEVGDDMPWLNQVIYEAGSDAAFRSIDRGENGTKPGVLAWQANPGYDHCTGLGVPDGTALLKRMLDG